MKVIIPAAGKGTRLLPLTYCCPKCMVEINGKPLIYWLLIELKKLDVEEVIIVTGHYSDMIENYICNKEEFPKTICLFNKFYETTNSIVSIALTRPYWDDDFCIIDSDLLIKQPLLKILLSCPQTSLILDNSKPVEQIDMKVSVANGYIKYMDKFLLKKDTFGEFFGLSKWNFTDSVHFSEMIEKCLQDGKSDIWYEFAIRELASKRKIPYLTCSSHSWIEIDWEKDYERAKLFFND